MIKTPRAVGLLLCALSSAGAIAEDLPLWEAGFGIAPVTFPDYRGSDHQQAYILPLPYLIYRGESLRVDRQGIRGMLVDLPRLSVDVSLDAAVPVSSDDNDARSGMPDLDPVIEIGPSINWALFETANTRWQLRLPVRAVIATDFTDAEHIGWKVHPMLNISMPNVAGGWDAGFNVGPLFASEDYHDYYYSVDPTFATAARPAYQASGGYSGTAVLASLSRRFDDIWVGAFVRYDNLSGAAFDDSPLVETDHALTAGLGVAWVFAESSRKVSAERASETGY